MKFSFARIGALLGVLSAWITNQAYGAELYFPNLGRNATGTTVTGKYALDVNIVAGAGGTLPSGNTWSLGVPGAYSLAVRKDSDGILTGIDDGEGSPLQIDANGRLKVVATTIEQAAAADGGALPSLTKVASGYDGTNVQVIKTDNTGSIQVDVESSALPAGAATETTLSTASGTLSAISGKLPASLTTAGNLSTEVAKLQGLVDTNNTTTATLAGGAVYTGTWTDITNYNGISLGVYSDVASATDGLVVQYSNDGTNVRHTHTYTVAAASGVGFNLTTEFRYMRVVYTNGASPQTVFALQTILKPTSLSPSMYRIAHAVTDETQATVNKSVIIGKTTAGGGSYNAVKVTPSGAVVTSIGDITDIDGQKTMALSVPVAIASDQSAIPATQSGTWNINNVSGTISLPTGAATESTLSTMNGKIPANLTVTSNRLVVDGSGVTQPVSAASLPLPTGASTSAKQDSIITELQTIKSQTARNTAGSTTAALEDVSTVAETQTAPANAVGFMIQADDTNTADIRFAVGATATATRGIQLQPGRSEYLEVGANVSVIAESGTQKYQMIWVTK